MMSDLAVLVLAGGLVTTGALLAFVVVPLLVRLRRLSAQAEKLLRDLDGDLPAMLKQARRTLEHLDGTLVEKLPALVSQATSTLERLDPSLSADLPGLIRETAQTVRRLNGDARSLE
jgi:hypothetical protein